MVNEEENHDQTGEIQAELHNGSTPEHDLQDSSFLLPTKIDRAGLSKMINDLLGLEKHVAFDILFNNEPLRTTLAEKLEEHKIESETTIKLTYTIAITEPEQENIDNLNDWISGIDHTVQRDLFATSCYEGNVSLYVSSGTEKRAEFVTANKSAAAIALHSGGKLGSKVELACGHINGLLEIYCLDASDSKSAFGLVSTSDSSNDTILAIAISAHGDYMAVSGNHPDILVYDNRLIIEKCNESESHSQVRAKRHIEDDIVTPVSTLSKHTKAVTRLEFLKPHENILVSASIDWNIAIWDVAEASLLAIYNCGKAITCFDISEDCSEICTGHEEGTIGVWKLTSRSDGAPPKTASDFAHATLTPHASACMFERLVSGVKVNPKDSNLFAAISLDGCAALIDRRFIKIPLQSVTFKNNDESDRGTGCCWISASELICCTASGAVRSLKFNELNEE